MKKILNKVLPVPTGNDLGAGVDIKESSDAENKESVALQPEIGGSAIGEQIKNPQDSCGKCSKNLKNVLFGRCKCPNEKDDIQNANNPNDYDGITEPKEMITTTARPRPRITTESNNPIKMIKNGNRCMLDNASNKNVIHERIVPISKVPPGFATVANEYARIIENGYGYELGNKYINNVYDGKIFTIPMIPPKIATLANEPTKIIRNGYTCGLNNNCNNNVFGRKIFTIPITPPL